MPRRKSPAPPPRRERDTGSVVYVERRKRWRARLPREADGIRKESWHLTRDEAEAWIVRELNRAPDSFDPSQTVESYMDYWLRLAGGRWDAQTARRYRYEANAIGATVRGTPLNRVRGDQFAAGQAAILERGCSRRYAYNVLSLYRRALADAVKWKILDENVVETVTLPEPEKKTARAWDIEEIRAVLTRIIGHRFEACYLLILWGGLRIGEVVGLRWDQIASDGTVAFEQAEKSHLRGRPLGGTKRDRSRETQIPAHVVARLKELRTAGPMLLAWPGRPRADVAYVYVAQRPDGSRWTVRKIRDDWTALVSGLKVQPLRPHGGRRSFGTAHMVSGTPLADLASLMGHANPAVTAASYLGTSKGRRQEAAERLAGLIQPDLGTIGGQIGGQADG